MICDEHKFIFVHLNKTGGTSIEKLFDSQADVLTNGITGNHDKHWTAADIQRAFPEKYATYFKFSFVRNPWNMVVSRYHWSRFHQVENGQPFLPSESFEAFVDR